MPLELKNSLNLPKTGFPMKANLPQNEPRLLERWEQIKIYDRIRESRAGAEIPSTARKRNVLMESWSSSCCLSLNNSSGRVCVALIIHFLLPSLARECAARFGL